MPQVVFKRNANINKKHIKKYLPFLVIRDMQIKIKLRSNQDYSMCQDTCHRKPHWESISLPSEWLSSILIHTV